MIKDYFRIALRSLARRKLRSWLTMIGIVIGISAVVALISMGQGLRVAIMSQFGNFGTDLLTVQVGSNFGPPGDYVAKKLTKSDLDKIKRLPEVKEAVGRIVKPCSLSYNNKLKQAMSASMPSGEDKKLVIDALNLEAAYGRLLKDSDSGKVIVGSNIADEKLFGKSLYIGSKLKVNGKPFEVVGILKKQGSFILDNLVFIEESEMRQLFGLSKDEYDLLVARVKPGADVAKAKESLEKLMRKQRHVKKGNEDFTVQSPQAMLEKVNSTLFAVQIFVYIIAAISIVVGGIGIMNTMLTSVLERTREIGIMKAIGARNRSIFWLFFIESGLLGSVGGIAGCIIGVALSLSLTKLGRIAFGSSLIHSEISMMLIFGSIVGSFLIGTLFGVIPALKASKLRPVIALSYRK